MDDFAFTPAERGLLHALTQRAVRFLVIGMAAAVLEGAPVATQDLDIWFERVDDERIKEAAKDAGGFWISGLEMQPPAFDGPEFSRFKVVLTAHGLDAFGAEYERSVERQVDDLTLRILPLARVIVSKRALHRLKDDAQLPVLEATLLAKTEPSDPEP